MLYKPVKKRLATPPRRSFWLFATATLLFSGCVTGSEEGKLRAEQAQVYSQMNDLLSDKSCSSASDCAITPVGSMACGGPASYLAYSQAIGKDKIAELIHLAERSKEVDSKLNALNKLMSPCVYHSAPTLVCENNQCATRYEPNGQLGVPMGVE